MEHLFNEAYIVGGMSQDYVSKIWKWFNLYSSYNTVYNKIFPKYEGLSITSLF